MDKFLYYAVKPFGINQEFGKNPDYYLKFGWKGHNGIDFFAPHATPLYAPCDGDAFYATDSHGGAGIYIRTTQDTKTYNVILWHLCTREDSTFHPAIPSDGSVIGVKTGVLLGYTDNSGAPFESSGDHLHFSLQPCDPHGTPIDKNNGYGGCIDPMPFFTGLFAQDAPEIDETIKNTSAVVQAIVEAPISIEEKKSFLQQIFNAFLKVAEILNRT